MRAIKNDPGYSFFKIVVFCCTKWPHRSLFNHVILMRGLILAGWIRYAKKMYVIDNFLKSLAGKLFEVNE